MSTRTHVILAATVVSAAALAALVRPHLDAGPHPADRRVAGPGGFERLPADAVRGIAAQSVDDYLRGRPAPDPARTRLYLLPLGWPPASRHRLVGLLAEHATAYFGRPTVVLPPETLGLAGIASRHHPETGQLQLHTKDVLRRLRDRLPADALCLMAITAVDLYPEPAWNFVFADSMPQERVSVMSLARYHPRGPQAAMGAGPAGTPGPASWLEAEPALSADPGRATPDQLAVLRALKVTTSQVGRVLGLAPCVEYRCTMNWTNSMGELDGRPLHACPTCLAKLGHALGFAPAARADALVRHYAAIGLPAESAWQATHR